METQTPDSNRQNEKNSADNNIVKTSVITLSVILGLGIAIFAGYRLSQGRQGGMVLPAGSTYLGASPTPEGGPSPTLVPKFTVDATTPYKEFHGIIYPFSFSYPETLNLLTFAETPPNDTIAIDWAGIPPQQNILLNVEKIMERDSTLINRPKKEFVENWWKYFSGLKGVASVTHFTNINGLNGYKAQYLNWTNTTPNTDIFFEVPSRPEIMVHMANGIIDAGIFDKMVDSFTWNTVTPTP